MTARRAGGGPGHSARELSDWDCASVLESVMGPPRRGRLGPIAMDRILAGARSGLADRRRAANRGNVAAARDALARMLAQTSKLEKEAQHLCEEVTRQFKLPLVAFQIIHPHKQVIETIAGLGPAGVWVGAAQHSLLTRDEKDDVDIQAFVALSQQAEVIRGWDKRFDKHLFHRFHHERALRAFIPVLVLRDGTSGMVCGDELTWQVPMQHGGRLSVPEPPAGCLLETIGTIEAGYLDGESKTISAGDLVAMAEMISERARTIYGHTFKAALEELTTIVMEMAGAPSATLHLLREPYLAPRDQSQFDCYSYNVSAGRAALVVRDSTAGRGGISDPPRKGVGLGALALEEGGPLFIPDPQSARPEWNAPDALRTFNPRIWNAHKVNAMAALPLDDGELQGVIYLHHFQPYVWDPASLKEVHHFIQRPATRAVRRMFDAIEERQRSRQVAALTRLTLFRARADEQQPTLEELAWAARCTLAADAVTVAVRVGRKQAFGSTAGSLGEAQLHAADAESWLAATGPEGAFRSDVHQENAEDRPTAELGAATGKFVSAAAVALHDSAQRQIGSLYVGFRAYRAFRGAEQEVIRSVAQLISGVIEGRPASDDTLVRTVSRVVTSV